MAPLALWVRAGDLDDAEGDLPAMRMGAPHPRLPRYDARRAEDEEPPLPPRGVRLAREGDGWVAWRETWRSRPRWGRGATPREALAALR